MMWIMAALLLGIAAGDLWAYVTGRQDAMAYVLSGAVTFLLLIGAAW